MWKRREAVVEREAMTRKDRIDRALERAQVEFEAHLTTKLLRERIAYHRTKIAEERAAKGDSRPT